ncbi:GEVED domain-containing protein, partial [Flavobacteriaceae bacterium]|nr:GEVED domain-containing protein [Flavobacteriaceae bacterium]
TGPTGPQDAGGSYMYYEGSNASVSASAVSPVIDLSSITAGNGAELTFYMHAYGATMGILRVGASTSPTGPFTNLITWGGQYQTAMADPWYQIGADVSAYVGGDLYIEFNNTPGGDYRSDMSIDTMEVTACDLIPSCNFPSDLLASEISDSSVRLDWTVLGTEVIWDIELVDVTASGSATGTPTTENINTNPYTLTGLLAQNDYELYLRADCGRGEVSDWVGPVSFTTTCATYTLPFQEDMENAGSTPDCWTTSSSSGRNWSFSTSATFGNTISDHTTGSGYFALVDATTTAVGTDITLESPLVDVSILGTPALRFYLHHFAVSGPSNSISVDVYTGTTWLNVYTDITGDINSWEEVTVILDPSTIAAVTKVRFVVDTQTAANYENDIGIDDVSFIEAPTCPNPSSLATSNITATSADLAWIAGDSEIAWDIELVDITASGSATGTPTTENINTNPYTLTGLLAQNDYEIYLRADCGRSEVSDWVGPVSFTTTCAPISTFPVTTDFTLNPPTSCWTQAADGDPTSGPTGLGGSEWSDGRSYNSIPSNRVNLFNLGSAEWLISPTYDIPALIAHELIINVAVTDYNSANAGAMGSDDEVQLLQTTDAGVTWTNITTWNAANQPSELGTSFTADLTSLSGTVQFAIWGSEGLVDDSEDFDFHVGAFTVREVPSCLEPTDLTATGQTLTTTDLAWTAGGTESLWNIEIYEQGADTSTATPVYTQTNATTTSTTATGLAIGDYTAYVQANCGGTDGVSPAASINFSIDYCTSTPSSNDGSGITNVQLGSTDFPTGDVTYADYRDTVVDLELDNTANLQVSFATGFTYGTNVWIDFNDDLVFDTTELVFVGTSQSTNPTTLDASFDIAVDAAQGTHYMRIGTADNGQATPNPCYSGQYGVTIDMAVNVIIPGSCNDLTIWNGTVWSNGAPTTNSYAHIGAAYATVTNGDIDACSLAINAATTVD